MGLGERAGDILIWAHCPCDRAWLQVPPAASRSSVPRYFPLAPLRATECPRPTSLTVRPMLGGLYEAPSRDLDREPCHLHPYGLGGHPKPAIDGQLKTGHSR